MQKVIALVGLIGVLLAGSALAQVAQAFSPQGSTTLSVTGSSARTVLPTAGPTVVVANTGTCSLFVKFGSSSVVAATTDLYVPPLTVLALNPQGQTNIAGITSGCSETVQVATGTGVPTFGQNGAVAISGSVSVINAGTFATQVTSLPATPAGANLIGKVGIDQTTPGTTNAVSVTNFPATQPVSGTVAVTQSTSPWIVGQSAAASLNATVVGTGTFATQSTVSQATAANLNATVVGTGTFATQATQSGTWTVQPGNTPNTAPWLVAPKAVVLTTAGCTVTASSSTCLAANSVTTHLQIQNTSSASTNNIACNFGGTAVLNDKGSFLLTPGQAANWGQATGVVPTGALNCIATSNPAQLYVEYN